MQERRFLKHVCVGSDIRRQALRDKVLYPNVAKFAPPMPKLQLEIGRATWEYIRAGGRLTDDDNNVALLKIPPDGP